MRNSHEYFTIVNQLKGLPPYYMVDKRSLTAYGVKAGMYEFPDGRTYMVSVLKDDVKKCIIGGFLSTAILHRGELLVRVMSPTTFIGLFDRGVSAAFTPQDRL